MKNGKIYIGSAKCFQVRASQHQTQLRNQKHHNKHLQASWDKHGADAFLFEVLEVIEGDKLARTTQEKKYLERLYENWEQCYNFQKNPLSSERSCWSKNPQKTKKQLSKSIKKVWENRTEKERKAISKKCSKSQKGRINSYETKEKIKKARVGQIFTEETRKK